MKTSSRHYIVKNKAETISGSRFLLKLRSTWEPRETYTEENTSCLRVPPSPVALLTPLSKLFRMPHTVPDSSNVITEWDSSFALCSAERWVSWPDRLQSSVKVESWWTPKYHWWITSQGMRRERTPDEKFSKDAELRLAFLRLSEFQEWKSHLPGNVPVPSVWLSRLLLVWDTNGFPGANCWIHRQSC